MKQKFNDHTICVWPATLVKGTDSTIEDFEKWLHDEFGVKGKYLEEFKTLPDATNENPIPETGLRNDLIFMVENNGVMKFAIPRLAYGISWWDDYVNNNLSIIPKDILDKYPSVYVLDESDFDSPYESYEEEAEANGGYSVTGRSEADYEDETNLTNL